jgi:hypothetical protein
MGWLLQPIQDWELKYQRDTLMDTSLRTRLASIVRSDTRDVATKNVDTKYLVTDYMILVNDKWISPWRRFGTCATFCVIHPEV